MKINWKVRLLNPYFYIALIAAIVTPIGVNFGVNLSDVTTWGMAVDLIKETFKSPFMVVTVGMSLLTFLVDPTTKGVGDSQEVLTYKKPKGDE